jgi:hypothetical protein
MVNGKQATPQPSAKAVDQSLYQIQCVHLPLAVYREIAAHLRQVTGVQAGLLAQRSQEFEYLKSQVGGLWIRYQPEADEASHLRVEQILAYYGDRYGAWEVVKPQASAERK